jgi:hypothetical protein
MYHLEITIASLSLFNVQVKIFSFFGPTMAMGFVEGGLEVNPT